MQAADLDVVKDIPGYKVILKTVLRSQIQQLVEQLALHTDEESVILTASVKDGTLCHLGSESGRSFLEDHDDVKSQFLGFCLKRYHSKKTELDKDMSAGGYSSGSSQMTPQRYTPGFAQTQRSVGPQPGSSSRTPNYRQEPYPRSRPGRKPQTARSQVSKTASSDMIKIEPNEGDSEDSAYGQTASTSQALSPAQTASDTRPELSGDGSNLSAPSAGDNDENPNSELSLGADLSGLVPTGADNDINDSMVPGSSRADSSMSGDFDASIKMEAPSESELDLEMTGAEPGSYEGWAPEGMVYDSTGAMGNQSDLQSGDQGYSQEPEIFWEVASAPNSTGGIRRLKRYICHCGKICRDKCDWARHNRIHTGEKPFECPYCEKKCALKKNLYQHINAVHAPQNKEKIDLLSFEHLMSKPPLE